MCMYNCDSSTIFQFVKKYGNVFSLDLGTFPSVLITGLPLIKEALVQQGENFSNRPVMPLQEHIFQHYHSEKKSRNITISKYPLLDVTVGCFIMLITFKVEE